MIYYKILKNKQIVGIGNTNCKNIPTDCRVFSYIKLTELQYNKLNLTFNGK